MQVARKVQVDVVHGQDLRHAAARRAAFHAENGTERRFAQCERRLFAYLVKPVCKSYRHGGFALARGRGVNRGDKNYLRLGLIDGIDLCDKISVTVNVLDTEFCRDLFDGQGLRFVSDFDVRFHNYSLSDALIAPFDKFDCAESEKSASPRCSVEHASAALYS